LCVKNAEGKRICTYRCTIESSLPDFWEDEETLVSISSQLGTSGDSSGNTSVQRAAKAIARVESAKNTVTLLRLDLRKLRAQATRELSSVKVSRIKIKIARTSVRLAKARATLRARYDLVVEMGLVKSR
jgi:hypothetical protein